MACAISYAAAQDGERSETLLEKGWRFHKGEASDAWKSVFDDSSWQEVRVPHDWAIYGPFSRNNDLQNVAVAQNFETSASLKTGRTGGLPYVGCGWYRRTFEVPEGKQVTLVFDGAMSEARVWVNGSEVCFWPYGYNSFWCDVTDVVRPGTNSLAVRLENKANSSRWYPGAGLYRNVRLVLTDPVHVPVWGTHVTTPHVSAEMATVKLDTRVSNASGREIRMETSIVDASGNVAASCTTARKMPSHSDVVTQNMVLESPELWSPEHPALYRALSTLYCDGRKVDSYETVFGLRKLEFIPHKGFYLNGERRKIHGVCNHHDLGPLGAAVNVSALRHQLELLKDMGCDAIRTSHNMPAPELVQLCDEMGFMMMLEPFDEWDVPKCENGYHRYFEAWAEKDMINMLHQYRNHPSVIMWSIGNEVPTQCEQQGYAVAAFLRDICHREDPSRPVTAGMDQVGCVLDNGFAEVMDIPGLNYRTFRYLEAYERLPQGLVLGSETASTVSSRGVYKLPAEKRFGAIDADHQCSSYDLDACWWSNIPDIDFALEKDYIWDIGQFVWTGFDYLGEPSPYDTDAWPNHSSMFGIIDLASIPKDRFYLYRSQWNSNEHTLHILPHWNWNKGDKVPVFVYTDYEEAELFVNGKSQGIRRFAKDAPLTEGGQKEAVEGRFRLMWDEVPFEKGELKAIAYEDGRAVDSVCVRTAGKPHHLLLESSVKKLKGDGKDLSYVTVSVVDRDGNLCPDASNLLQFKLSGAGHFRAVANGDPTCLESFQEPQMHAFHGKLTVIVESSEATGQAVLSVSGKGLKPSSMSWSVEN